MEEMLREKLSTAIWIAKSLFDRGKTSGSTANMSFRHHDRIYITGSGTCFGTLHEDSFSAVSMDGKHLEGIAPSKEFPLHSILYGKNDQVQAVIHTHSFYAALWSCLDHSDPTDVIPNYTPYLRMKVGAIGLVPYAKPGSQELFDFFAQKIGLSDGYLLQNHGPVIGGASLMEAFFGIEELEESARIAWSLKDGNIKTI